MENAGELIPRHLLNNQQASHCGAFLRGHFMKRERRGPLNLLHGDIVIATQISHYTHAGAEGVQSQEIGDMLLVNNPYNCGRVQGCSLMPGSVALGSSLAAGTYRLAKPSDKHYVMTVQEWDRYQPKRFVRALYNLPFHYQLFAAVMWTMLLIEAFV